MTVTYGRLEVFSENSWFPPPTKPLYILITVESGFKNNSNPDKYFMIYSLILLFYLYYEMKTWRLMVNNSTERQLYWLSFDLRLLITHLVSSTNKLTATINLIYCWKCCQTPTILILILICTTSAMNVYRFVFVLFWNQCCPSI